MTQAKAGSLDGADLVVVDLEGGGPARVMVRRAAMRHVRSARRGRGVRLLVHEAPDEAFPVSGAFIVRTRDVKSADLTVTAHRWVLDASRAILRAYENHFPVVKGVHLGELNLLALQGTLAEFVSIVAATVSMIERAAPRRCVVLSADPERAQALAGLVRSLQIPAIAWSPPATGLLRGLSRRRRQRAQAADAGARRLPALGEEASSALAGSDGVLVMSESGPIHGMFDSVEPELVATGVRPVVRVRLGAPRQAVARRPGVVQIEVAGPLVARATRFGRFARQWRAMRSRARAHPLFVRFGELDVRVPTEVVLEYLFLELFDQQWDHVHLADELLELAHPKAVVVGNDRWWIGVAFVLLARAKGLPTICVQDGLVVDVAFWWWITADVFCASGVDAVRILRRGDVEPQRLVVTGQPRYDRLPRYRTAAHAAAVRARLGLAADDYAVLVATQPHQTVEYCRSVVEALLETPSVRVLLRAHPSEPVEKYASLDEIGGGRIMLPRNEEIFDLVTASDLVVNEYSTVTIEAAMLGKPVVTANFEGRGLHVPFGEMGLAVRAMDRDALAGVVRDFATDPAGAHSRWNLRADAAEELMGVCDGHASARVARVITSVARDGLGVVRGLSTAHDASRTAS